MDMSETRDVETVGLCVLYSNGGDPIMKKDNNHVGRLDDTQ